MANSSRRAAARPNVCASAGVATVNTIPVAVSTLAADRSRAESVRYIGRPAIERQLPVPTMQAIELRVRAVTGKECVVRAFLHDRTVLHHDDAVGERHRAEPVRDEDRRPTDGEVAELREDSVLRL